MNFKQFVLEQKMGPLANAQHHTDNLGDLPDGNLTSKDPTAHLKAVKPRVAKYRTDSYFDNPKIENAKKGIAQIIGYDEALKMLSDLGFEAPDQTLKSMSAEGKVINNKIKNEKTNQQLRLYKSVNRATNKLQFILK